MRAKFDNILCGQVMASVLFAAAHIAAAPIRIASWNLLPSSAVTNANSREFQQRMVLETADQLKRIEPDVILLQNIADWKTCDQIARALSPGNYNVTFCSSFGDSQSPQKTPGQVAILAKNRSYISWSEAWQNDEADAPVSGGYGFAAIHVGGRNVGFFSAKLGDGPTLSPANETVEKQLFKQVAAVHAWKTNKLYAFVVGGDFGINMDAPDFANGKTSTWFHQIGFVNVLAALPAEKRLALAGDGGRAAATGDLLFAQGVGKIESLQLARSAILEHSCVIWDLDLDAPQSEPQVETPTVATIESAPPITTTSTPTKPVALATAPVPANPNRNWVWWVTGIFGAFALVFLMGRRLNRQPSLPPAKPTALIGNSPVVRIEVTGATSRNLPVVTHGVDSNAHSQPMPDAVREGVIANITAWMKSRVFRRLMSDRAELLASQQAAAQKLLVVDERLTKIERDIQSRNREYELRIDALMTELVTSREENRELIRAKIAIVKAEMERERLRAEQSLKEERGG